MTKPKEDKREELKFDDSCPVCDRIFADVKEHIIRKAKNELWQKEKCWLVNKTPHLNFYKENTHLVSSVKKWNKFKNNQNA